ncbi:ribonuclease T2 [Amorphus orientalis]|uniref:Ribonuclease T2 n=1 Tax=Amorphus orientalis TaxID=649198 RepID=A0AAE3VR73_9HYPH|nr:ribonuclease T2 [Amorphus orientalis]MDQ0316672.1 ribonuclease T2 [Amorphus orientalis]
MAFALLLAGSVLPARADGTPGSFDFYVLSLSWSPSYCAAAGDRADKTQCDSGRPYAFVVHGLWPQYNRGYPEHCAAGGDPPRRLVNSMLDIMPSRSLVRHEWDKHGTCSGLSPVDYFSATRKAFERITIPSAFQEPDTAIVIDPADLERAFRTTNEGLAADEIAVICRGNRIREVRICMTRDLSAYRSCPEVDRNACTKAGQRMPPVRSR